MLLEHADDKNSARTCLYLVSCCNYLPEPDNVLVLRTAYDIYTKMAKYPDAMRVALKMNSKADVEATFAACSDPQERRQLCHLLARQGFVIDLEDGPAAVADDDEREVLVEIMSNSKLSEYYLMLARDLDVMEPKTPQDVYKSHLVRAMGCTSCQERHFLGSCSAGMRPAVLLCVASAASVSC